MDKIIDRRTLSENKIGIVGAKKKANADKSTPVIFYVKGKEIEAVGGLEAARAIAKSAVEIKAKRGKRK